MTEQVAPQGEATGKWAGLCRSEEPRSGPDI